MFQEISLRIVAAFQTAAVRGLRREEGQTLVEYALVLVLVSVAAIAALGFLSSKIDSELRRIANIL